MDTVKHRTGFMKKRHDQLIERALEFYPTLGALVTHAPNDAARGLAVRVRRNYDAFFGKPSPSMKLTRENLADFMIDAWEQEQWIAKAPIVAQT